MIYILQIKNVKDKKVKYLGQIQPSIDENQDVNLELQEC